MLRDQDRIRPLALARNWCLSGESVTHACLVAARAGVLTVRWEVLCPSCRGPQESLPKLSFRGMRIHCYSCNLKFDGTLADALEVTFRPAPDIRTINLQVACAGSPGRQPHVLAQGVLPPDGQLEWMMTLEPGQYRLATIPMDNAGAGSDGRLNANPVLVDVAEDASERRGTIQLASTGMQPQRLHLRPGPIRLVVDSEVPAAMALKLETRWQGEDVLTAGNLLENPKARGLIPGDTLDPAFTAEVLQKGVLVAESFHDHQGTLDALESALQASGSNHLHRGERKLVASFSEPSALLQAALAIVRNADAQIALGWGSVVEAQEDGQTAIWGTAVQHAQSVLPAARPGTMVVSEGPAQQAELGRAALELGLSIKQQEGRLPGGRPVYVFSAESKP